MVEPARTDEWTRKSEPIVKSVPMEIVYEVTYWFEKRFRGECRAERRGKSFGWCFSKKPVARLEKGLGGVFECVLKWKHHVSGGCTARGQGPN